MTNKERMKLGLRVLLLFIWALLTIATCAAVWNLVKDVTLIIASVLLFGFNAIAIHKAAKMLSKVDKTE